MTKSHMTSYASFGFLPSHPKSDSLNLFSNYNVIPFIWSVSIAWLVLDVSIMRLTLTNPLFYYASAHGVNRSGFSSYMMTLCLGLLFLLNLF